MKNVSLRSYASKWLHSVSWLPASSVLLLLAFERDVQKAFSSVSIGQSQFNVEWEPKEKVTNRLCGSHDAEAKLALIRVAYLPQWLINQFMLTEKL